MDQASNRTGCRVCSSGFSAATLAAGWGSPSRGGWWSATAGPFGSRPSRGLAALSPSNYRGSRGFPEPLRRLRRHLPMNGEEPAPTPPHEWGGALTNYLSIYLSIYLMRPPSYGWPATAFRPHTHLKTCWPLPPPCTVKLLTITDPANEGLELPSLVYGLLGR